MASRKRLRRAERGYSLILGKTPDAEFFVYAPGWRSFFRSFREAHAYRRDLADYGLRARVVPVIIYMEEQPRAR